MCLRLRLLVGVLLLATVTSAEAKVIFVNNQTGADRADGMVEVPTNESSGPVRSLKRALQLARPGDSIDIANTGEPYFESISVVGKRRSGVGKDRLRIVGNGAVLSGARAVPEGGWQKVGDDLWKLNPWRKGTFLLVLHGKTLTEVRPETGSRWNERPPLEVDQWCSFRGEVYYRSAEREEPHGKPFSIAGHDCGITIYGAQDVEVSDLTIQHFRLDGIGVPDLAKRIELQNVRLIENGRAGLTIGGSALVTVKASTIEKNGRHSVLVHGLGAANVVESTLDADPSFE